MATVYILYSSSLDRFYIGSCLDVQIRLNQHLSQYFPNAFTSKAQDWEIYLLVNNLTYLQARKIEAHIKKMKSRRFIENLKKYPEILEKLAAKYRESLK